MRLLLWSSTGLLVDIYPLSSDSVAEVLSGLLLTLRFQAAVFGAQLGRCGRLEVAQPSFPSGSNKEQAAQTLQTLARCLIMRNAFRLSSWLKLTVCSQASNRVPNRDGEYGLVVGNADHLCHDSLVIFEVDSCEFQKILQPCGIWWGLRSMDLG